MPKRGLPVALQMRHDAHYVEALASSAAPPVGRLIPIDKVDPNPDQPRHASRNAPHHLLTARAEGHADADLTRPSGYR